MNDNIKKIADAWEEVSNQAQKNVSSAADEFQKRAVLVGGLAVISGSAIASFDGGVLSQGITIGTSLAFMSYASYEARLKEKFYDAMSIWALEKRDEVIIANETDIITKPRFDVEKVVFSKIYKAPSIIRNVTDFRTLAIASTIAASVTAFNPNRDLGITLFDRFRKEGSSNEQSFIDRSNLAPAMSPRPFARP